MWSGFVARAGAAAAALSLFAFGVAPASAGPALLLEPATGQVLYAEEPDRVWHPASVTKLMTAYIVFEAVKAGDLAWDADVPLSQHARMQPATRIGLRGGIKVNVEQAVRGMILRSANDLSTALAERIAGTEEAFIERMNATARRLGMTRTRFKNPHGLPDPDQVSTARDLALLSIALIKDFPDRADVFANPIVRIHKGTFHSSNDLLRTLEGADGMKTGFTCSSGYNVVASATRGGRQLVAVVLGALNRTTRSERAVELLEAGFAHFGPKVQPTEHFTGAAPAAPAAPTEAVTGGASPAGATPVADEAAAAPKPLAIKPVALKDMAMSPADALAPHDMARETRTRKCGNSERIVRKSPKPAVAKAPAAGTAAVPAATAAVVTGSVAAPPAGQRKPVVRTVPATESEGDGK